ncbi:1-deoxy-D-xylulose-5-phosphate reductoisomerase [Parasphaerochaeta coccoides]|uniref:1-deoxy-D-xylulose 5-phosphate reductoisomerase n=1 Tax=Parasphaerochaeta coccoides (strain ATCC BAA-1237 / DSM 17374 / SPN1) TaxID=760011 RepID=F4GLF1_PARC1|nr:1-deoxy-D-xylulose-5-phosphate reductoisomerase [Parasphaerochaeta coccoides]AEC01921.1 1-deoxy-D-xylulose 5-phosphate reductoisomerase [Parasphaerochaeta coccoides DSM 17374]
MRNTATCRSAIILGCTGSIGITAIKGLSALSSPLRIRALSAHTQAQKLIDSAVSLGAEAVCLTGARFSDFPVHCPADVRRYDGPHGLRSMLEDIHADVVLNGIAGADGLAASRWTLENGMDLALANKETIVMAGSLIENTARRNSCSIFPVDSEHSALKALIDAHGRERVSSLVITASGGPFRTIPMEKLYDITPEQATAHPTWSMGRKISVDSATLANKGLELIEAARLFSFDSSCLEIVIHPQSIVHSMIRMVDGAVYAQLSPPDMSLPILSALAGGVLPGQGVKALDFTHISLEFEKADEKRFPFLALARSCIKGNDALPIVFNAANEVAVHAFLARTCRFPDIYATVEEALARGNWSQYIEDYEDVMQVDASARRIAQDILSEKHV